MTQMTRGDAVLIELVKQVHLLLELIGGATNLNRELSYYDFKSLRQQFPTVEGLTVRLFDSWWNTTRRQLLVKNRFQKLRQAVHEEGNGSLSSMSIPHFKAWLMSALDITLAEIDQKQGWKQFIEGGGAWACLRFIGQFTATTDFYNWVATRVGVDCWDNVGGNWENYAKASWELAEHIAYHMPEPQSGKKGIYGMGTVLVCDFLKEVGVNYYGKPDSQVKGVFEKLGLIGKRDQDRETFDLFWSIAAVTGHPPAVVDKILWMASSGRWDRTLDTKYSAEVTRKMQRTRKEQFYQLMNRFLWAQAIAFQVDSPSDPLRKDDVSE